MPAPREQPYERIGVVGVEILRQDLEQLAVGEKWGDARLRPVLCGKHREFNSCVCSFDVGQQIYRQPRDIISGPDVDSSWSGPAVRHRYSLGACVSLSAVSLSRLVAQQEAAASVAIRLFRRDMTCLLVTVAVSVPSPSTTWRGTAWNISLGRVSPAVPSTQTRRKRFAKGHHFSANSAEHNDARDREVACQPVMQPIASPATSAIQLFVCCQWTR